VKLAELDYELPGELIAQAPAEPRDSARLLCVDRMGAGFADRSFADLPGLLAPGDLLVRNDTRVLPARTHFARPTGGRLEVLFLESTNGIGTAGREWQVLVRGRPRDGETLVSLDPGGLGWRVRVTDELGEGRWRVESLADEPVPQLLARAGVMPLPPYIRAALDDPEKYQTVFARHPGSAAAPTAGLHFTRALDERLTAAGVEIVDLTLHVGLGTFKPLSAEMLAAGRLHSEPYVVEGGAWRRVASAYAAGRRLIAVGTTMVRLLETLAREPAAGLAAAPAGRPPAAEPHAGLKGRTSLFISPGFEFRLVGGMITNFHLPRTSLLALVMAFCGAERTRAAYAHAIAARYRFYSFGDAMLIL
jgi:S-adenosylmethionine:tRNA ribosyltransferase-isomerase